MARAGRWLPARSHPARHPALTWSVALPIWIALARGLPVVRTRGSVSVDRCRCFSAGFLLSLAPPAQRPARSHRVARRARRVRDDVAARGERVVALHRRHHGPAADRHAVLRLRGGAERRRPDGGSTAHRGRRRRTAAAQALGNHRGCLRGAGRDLRRRLSPRLPIRTISRCAGTCGRCRRTTRPPRRGRWRRSSPDSISRRTRQANGPRPTVGRRRRASRGAATAFRSCSAPTVLHSGRRRHRSDRSRSSRWLTAASCRSR